MDISVVIPVYGCPAALPELHERLCTSLSKITESFEIILVNDACPKGSWAVIEELCAKDHRVVGVELSRNFGQIYAIAAGMDIAKGNYVVVMDCDGQDRPEEILNLYAKAQEGYDVVFARRAVRKDGFIKRLVSRMFYGVYSYASGTKYDPAICNFSIITRRVADSYCAMRERHRAYVAYIKWLGFRETAIDVEHCERIEGKSSYNFKKRMKMAGDILISQSDKALKLAVKLGLLLTFLSLGFAIWLIVNYFINDVLSGWTSTLVVLCFLAGILEVSIGLVGLYVGNIYMQVKERPLYVVRSVLNGEEKSK